MPLIYQRLRAPQTDGQSLQVPPSSEWATTLLNNQLLGSGHAFTLAGTSLDEVRRDARKDLIQAALEYTGRYREIFSRDANAPIVMAGHQPTLFHPGVWYKNFVLSRFAETVDAWAVNLVVDNDYNPSRSVAVPTGSLEQPKIEWLKYDSQPANGPFETESLHSREVFSRFGKNVEKTLGPMVGPVVDDLLIKRLWPFAMAGLDLLGKPSLAVASGRHRLEQEFGLRTLEVPVSHFCRTQSFAYFAAELIERAPALKEVYNEQLLKYRQIHRIRSQSHPVPELKEFDGWIEVPFWVWRSESSLRRPLFVEIAKDAIKLTDLADIALVLDRNSDMPSQIQEWEAQGVCLRTRALTTTMYARLVLCDLFVHGIGGGKYDQLTDEVIREFWGAEPPAFSIVTATHQLPIASTVFTKADVTRLQNRLRDLNFHAEHFGDFADERFKSYAEKKTLHWQQIPQSGSKKDWHDEMDRINGVLRQTLEKERADLEREIQATRQAVQKSELLSSREFSFCLFDEGIVASLSD